MRQRFWTHLMASSALIIAPKIVMAQTAASPAGVIADGHSVQEIVVTATRRPVDLQKVPGTVEAVPASTLKALNITSALQLSDVTPGLVMAASGGNNAFLRGIGSASTGFNEAQLAVYIDGLYLPNPAASIYSFNNIEQVEVLKGPQGTLYGRNATAGLIAVTTRDPGSTPRVDASVGYGNYNTLTLNFYGSMPITNTLAANIAVYHAKQSDGYVQNVFTGNRDMKSDETGVESKLLWKPAPSTKVTLSFIYDYNARDNGYANAVYPGTVASDGTTYLGPWRDSSRIDPRAPYYGYTGSLKIEQDFGFATLKSLTGFQTSHQAVLFNPAPDPGQPLAGEGSPIDEFFERNRTWTQEFTLTSKPSGSRLDWIVGAFYYRDRSALRLNGWTTCVGNVCAPRFTPTSNVGYPTTDSYSVYGDATYRLFTATHLTIGLRYTDETKGLTGSVVPLPGFPDSVAVLPPGTVTAPGQPYLAGGVLQPGIPPTLNFKKLTYRFVLAQDVGENVHLYVSDNLGFKSGAYNANLFTNPPVLPETLYAYEAGVKSELFERRVRLNLAAFYYNYQNVQVRSTQGAPVGNSFLENAATERQYGVDGDFNVVVTRQFTINGGFEVLHSRYVNFPGTTCSTPGTKIDPRGVVVGAPTIVPCNLAGFTTPWSPALSGSIGFIYRVDSSYGSWALAGNDHFNTPYPLVADGTVVNNAHDMVDASLTWTAPRKNFNVQLYVRNLLNQFTYQSGFAAASNNYYVTMGAPRTYGVTVGYHF